MIIGWRWWWWWWWWWWWQMIIDDDMRVSMSDDENTTWRLWCRCWRSWPWYRDRATMGGSQESQLLKLRWGKTLQDLALRDQLKKKTNWFCVFFTSRSDFENLFLYYITSISLSHYFNVLPSDWCSKNFFRNSHWSPAGRGGGMSSKLIQTLYISMF